MRFSKQTRYLGMLIDENLSMNSHNECISGRLRKANGALSLIRHYVPFSILRSIYYALFQPHIQYGLQIWRQNLSPNSRIIRLQKIAVRLLTFAEYNATTKPLFARTKYLASLRLCFQAQYYISPSNLKPPRSNSSSADNKPRISTR